MDRNAQAIEAVMRAVEWLASGPDCPGNRQEARELLSGVPYLLDHDASPPSGERSQMPGKASGGEPSPTGINPPADSGEGSCPGDRAPSEKIAALIKRVEWVLNDAAYKPKEQKGYVACRWEDVLRDALDDYNGVVREDGPATEGIAQAPPSPPAPSGEGVPEYVKTALEVYFKAVLAGAEYGGLATEHDALVAAILRFGRECAEKAIKDWKDQAMLEYLFKDAPSDPNEPVGTPLTHTPPPAWVPKVYAAAGLPTPAADGVEVEEVARIIDAECGDQEPHLQDLKWERAMRAARAVLAREREQREATVRNCARIARAVELDGASCASAIQARDCASRAILSTLAFPPPATGGAS